MKKTVKPFFVAYGSEPFLLDRDLEVARSTKDRQATVLDGEDLTDEQLVTLCESTPWDEHDRIIIVDNAQKVVGKALAAYVDAKAPADVDTVLVAIIRSDKLPEVWGKAAAKGRLVVHQKLKTWDNNNEVVRWTIREALSLELTLSEELAGVLFNQLGGDLYRIYGELQKLKLICGSGKVTREQIVSVLSPSPKPDPLEVAEATVNKDLRAAMFLLSGCYRAMGDEANVPVASSLVKQVEKLLVARSLLDQGADETAIGPALDLHPYRCKVHVLPRARKHTVPQLVSYMRTLRRLDVEVKGPSLSKRTLVELAVYSIAR